MMKDPYRIAEAPADRTRRGPLRPALWTTLFLSAAANMVFSTGARDPLIGSVFGLIALACAAALIVHHYRHRAR
jgi:hypothetical protein